MAFDVFVQIRIERSEPRFIPELLVGLHNTLIGFLRRQGENLFQINPHGIVKIIDQILRIAVYLIDAVDDGDDGFAHLGHLAHPVVDIALAKIIAIEHPDDHIDRLEIISRTRFIGRRNRFQSRRIDEADMAQTLEISPYFHILTAAEERLIAMVCFQQLIDFCHRAFLRRSIREVQYGFFFRRIGNLHDACRRFRRVRR